MQKVADGFWNTGKTWCFQSHQNGKSRAKALNRFTCRLDTPRIHPVALIHLPYAGFWEEQSGPGPCLLPLSIDQHTRYPASSSMVCANTPRCLMLCAPEAGSLPQQNVSETGGRRRYTALCSTPAPSRSACGDQARTSVRGGPFSRGRRSERDSAVPVTGNRHVKGAHVTHPNIKRLPQEDRTVDLSMGTNHSNIPN